MSYYKVFGDTTMANSNQVDINTSLWLTRNWQVNYGFYFDVFTGER